MILFQKLIFLIIKISKALQPLESSAIYFLCSFFVYVSKYLHNFLLISTISNNFLIKIFEKMPFFEIFQYIVHIVE